MKAEELRVGIILEGGWIVSRMDIGAVIFGIEKWKDGQRRKISNPQPEPLTEEWLKKFGFESNGNEYFLTKKVTGIYRSGMMSVCLRYLKTEHFAVVKYVHSLQNLIFALTGEELTIKEMA